jgi:hypothetical protein
MAVPEPGHSFRERVVDGHHPVQPPHPELAGLLGLRLASGFHRPSNLSSEAGQSSGFLQAPRCWSALALKNS